MVIASHEPEEVSDFKEQEHLDTESSPTSSGKEE